MVEMVEKNTIEIVLPFYGVRAKAEDLTGRELQLMKKLQATPATYSELLEAYPNNTLYRMIRKLTQKGLIAKAGLSRKTPFVLTQEGVKLLKTTEAVENGERDDTIRYREVWSGHKLIGIAITFPESVANSLTRVKGARRRAYLEGFLKMTFSYLLEVLSSTPWKEFGILSTCVEYKKDPEGPFFLFHAPKSKYPNIFRYTKKAEKSSKALPKPAPGKSHVVTEKEAKKDFSALPYWLIIEVLEYMEYLLSKGFENTSEAAKWVEGNKLFTRKLLELLLEEDKMLFAKIIEEKMKFPNTPIKQILNEITKDPSVN